MYYTEKSWPVNELLSMNWIENGPVRATLELKYRCVHSTICQKVHFYANVRRIDFETTIDWKEHQHLLKVEFPVDIHTDEATFDIQFGNVTRKIHTNTSWEQARFESCGQKWIDFSEGHYGVSVLNDCKYGYYVREGVLDLALLRSPKYPDRYADQGEQIFTYSFLPHKNALPNSDVMREAANLNRQLLVADGYEAGIAKMPFRLEANHIVMDVVKRGEKDDSLIIRLIETGGGYSEGTLHFAQAPAAVYETDLMEWNNIRQLDTVDSTLSLAMTPFEIRTLRIEMADH
jgi:alpha-mannosidase